MACCLLTMGLRRHRPPGHWGAGEGGVMLAVGCLLWLGETHICGTLVFLYKWVKQKASGRNFLFVFYQDDQATEWSVQCHLATIWPRILDLCLCPLLVKISDQFCHSRVRAEAARSAGQVHHQDDGPERPVLVLPAELAVRAEPARVEYEPVSLESGFNVFDNCILPFEVLRGCRFCPLGMAGSSQGSRAAEHAFAGVPGSGREEGGGAIIGDAAAQPDAPAETCD